MTSVTRGSGWDRASRRVVLGLCGLKALVHLACVNRYGYHGDELYFIECGRHLAFGYVDHPPLIPWIARVADELGGSLVALRLPAIAAGVGTMLFTALLVREWGGGWRAQLLALLCLLVAPAHLRLAAMLDIPVVEVFLCTLTAYLVARALSRGERWPWLLAGGALGWAVLAKHGSLLWGGALGLGILATPSRQALASRWPWLGVTAVCLLAAPNLAWQADKGFATFEFMRTLRSEVLVGQGRGLFVAGQLRLGPGLGRSTDGAHARPARHARLGGARRHYRARVPVAAERRARPSQCARRNLLAGFGAQRARGKCGAACRER